MKNEIRNIKTLHNWNKNPRAIKKEDFERLRNQIKELGQYKPLIITSDGEVLGGNMRLRAYQELGISDIWVSIVEPKTEADKIKIALSDNDRAGYYIEQDLAELITNFGIDINLDNYKVDLGKTITLTDLLNQFRPDTVEDEAPEVSSEPAISKLGERYQLGRHYLFCGDATKIEDVEKLMDGKKADMVFTDPPYGMDLDTDYSGMVGIARGNKYDKVIGDDKPFDYKWFDFLDDIKEQFWWGGDYYVETLPNFGKDGSWFVWDKTGGGVSPNSTYDKMFGSNFEMCWSKQKHKRNVISYVWKGFFGLSQEDTKSRIHPTQKPRELINWFIKQFAKDNDIVLDLFGGSGSTLIACEQTNRTCYMMEIDEKYCDVIRKRYENFVGKEDKWQKIK